MITVFRYFDKAIHYLWTLGFSIGVLLALAGIGHALLLTFGIDVLMAVLSPVAIQQFRLWITLAYFSLMAIMVIRLVIGFVLDQTLPDKWNPPTDEPL